MQPFIAADYLTGRCGAPGAIVHAHAVPRAFQIHGVDEETDAPAAVDDPKKASADGAIDAPVKFVPADARRDRRLPNLKKVGYLARFGR